MSPADPEFAARLRAMRGYAGVPQSEVADHVGRTTDTISNWERGETSPSASEKRAIAKWLWRKAADAGFSALDADFLLSPGRSISPPVAGNGESIEARLEAIETTLSGLVVAETERHTEVMRVLRRWAQ